MATRKEKTVQKTIELENGDASSSDSEGFADSDDEVTREVKRGLHEARQADKKKFKSNVHKQVRTFVKFGGRSGLCRFVWLSGPKKGKKCKEQHEKGGKHCLRHKLTISSRDSRERSKAKARAIDPEKVGFGNMNLTDIKARMSAINKLDIAKATSTEPITIEEDNPLNTNTDSSSIIFPSIPGMSSSSSSSAPTPMEGVVHTGVTTATGEFKMPSKQYTEAERRAMEEKLAAEKEAKELEAQAIARKFIEESQAKKAANEQFIASILNSDPAKPTFIAPTYPFSSSFKPPTMSDSERRAHMDLVKSRFGV